MKARNRFDAGGNTSKNTSEKIKTPREGREIAIGRKFKYSGMTEKEAYSEWKKTATGNTRGAAGLSKFDNSLPKNHPFKDKKRTTGRYKNHPIGKLLD